MPPPSQHESLLIIFYRNPELGKVKTRLAATVGDVNALNIYISLSAYTRKITENIAVDKYIFYSHFKDNNDHWHNLNFKKHKQSGDDLGTKMYQAFQVGFESGYKSICIIGTDCFELTQEIIEDAFSKLKSHDAVIGPASDGGYYLLGINALYPELFTNKSWSTNSVCEDTINNLKVLKLKHYTLPILNDVDEEKDLPDALR